MIRLSDVVRDSSTPPSAALRMTAIGLGVPGYRTLSSDIDIPGHGMTMPEKWVPYLYTTANRMLAYV